MGAIFGVITYLSNKKDPKEYNLKHILSLKTGGQFGFINLSIPFVRTTLYEDFLVLSYWKKLIIPYEEIIKLEKSGLFNSGFRIITKNGNKYGTPLIWTFNKERREIIISQMKKRVTAQV